MSIRDAIVAEIELLASPSEQLEYERNVHIADVPAELICGFCDDLYHPTSEAFLSGFTADEVKDLAHLYGVLVEASKINVSSVNELLKCQEWQTVVSAAKELTAHYARSD